MIFKRIHDKSALVVLHFAKDIKRTNDLSMLIDLCPVFDIWKNLLGSCTGRLSFCQGYIKGSMIGLYWLNYTQSTIFERMIDEAALADLHFTKGIWNDRSLGYGGRLMTRKQHLNGSTMKLHWPTSNLPKIFERIDAWDVLDDISLINDIWKDP